MGSLALLGCALLAGIVIPWITYRYGLRRGRECSCCGFAMDCRICVLYKCEKALNHLREVRR